MSGPCRSGEDREIVKLSNEETLASAWEKSRSRSRIGHLSQLAAANGAVVAALDESIAGSYVIPQ